MKYLKNKINFLCKEEEKEEEQERDYDISPEVRGYEK